MPAIYIRRVFKLGRSCGFILTPNVSRNVKKYPIPTLSTRFTVPRQMKPIIETATAITDKRARD